MDCTVLAEVMLSSYLTEAKKLVRRAAALSMSRPKGESYPNQQQRLDDRVLFLAKFRCASAWKRLKSTQVHQMKDRLMV